MRWTEEDLIQREVVARLRLARVVFCHVPNASKATRAYRAKMHALGVEAGIPDLLVFSLTGGRAPSAPMALELKTARGRLSDAQREKLEQLTAAGWSTAVSYGLDAALVQLVTWGVLWWTD